MSGVRTILQYAEKLVERGWTTGVLARAEDDSEVCMENPQACRFCALGAIVRARYDLDATVAAQKDSIRALQRALFSNVSDDGFAAAWPPSILAWNDRPGRTQAEVVALFRRAIAAVKGESLT